ncbi:MULTISPECIES: bifunctional GrpB family protein/GNAT family N-acetyltransferase [Legionella]|uniref:Glutamate rich protein GrpB n=1 Tax=Legionella drozanskii LLAP-1 TaxID=1212489 RepID=A0A0W0TAK4_9GAMM|nr:MULTISPECIES: bifunctional GrpB family protein/GNAT family N-acetyltransferase [Legionella]KTC92585.1 glutamate rich protein GrpB [Legionella drozanskii LLAP-1]PJE12285.1 MAG: GNAT family N-acetyltransferase [Legionella sp.]
MNDQRLIEVVPYDPAWPTQFSLEASLVKNALGDNCIEIHHMGSTAVPGLAAKPVIDMIPVVKDISKVDAANLLMGKLGYEARGEYGILFRRYFQKGGNHRTHHAHVFEVGNPEIERHLKFRNWMRANPEDRKAYGKLKQSLAVQYPHDMDAYCLGKDSFIAEIDKKTGFKGLRIVHALTPREWAAAKHLRHFYFFDRTGIPDPYTWTFDDPKHIHFLLYQGSDIVGYAHIQQWPNHRAAMRIIVIDEPYRNQGIGGQFLELCERWLRQVGFITVHIEASKVAKNFYLKLNYIELPFNHLHGYESHPEDIAMAKKL